MMSRILFAGLVLGLAAPAAEAQTDLSHPWNPADPLPKFITHVLVDPANLTAISKYRSCVGHAFVDNYEYNIDQSLKNYYLPGAQFANSNTLLRVYAPTTGVITNLTGDDGLMSQGGSRGYTVNLASDAYPMFGLVIFHINVLPSIVVGAHVNAGDLLGYGDIREAANIDMAVQAIWNAKPLVQNLDPGAPLTTPGYKYVSAFDVMTDAVFAQFAPYGLTDRASMIVTLAYREAHTFTNQGNTPNGLDPNEYFIYPPWFDTQPQSTASDAGFSVELMAYGDCQIGPFAYQWSKNGVPIPGATGLDLLLYDVQASDMGFYTSTITTPSGSTQSMAAVLIVNSGGQSRLANLSTRGMVLPGGVLTAGFAARGPGVKSLLIRGVGPALAQFGVGGFLQDTKLQLIAAGSSTALLSNDNWVENSPIDLAAASVGAFPLSPGSKDAATLASVPVGTTYSMQVASTDPTQSGVALAEIYDADPEGSPARLINLSALSFTGSGAQTLTVGFAIGGAAPKRVLLRVVGPGLAQFGVAGALADPQLTLIPAGLTSIAAANSGWSGGGNQAALQSAFAAAGAFALSPGSNDAAVVIELPPGAYTMQASSVSGAQGVVLAEIYDLDP